MTLLTICQDTADELALIQPATIIGNVETTALRLLAAARASAKSLARRPWVVLVKEHTFNTANGTASYALPTDFQHMLVQTAWDRANNWRMWGPISASDWQQVKSGIVTTTQTRKRFRIKPDAGVKKFFLDPTPTAVEALVFEYLSDAWANGAALTSNWVADSDVALFDEYVLQLDLKWRVLRGLGLAYESERADAERETRHALANDGVMEVLNMAPEAAVVMGNIPEAGFG